MTNKKQATRHSWDDICPGDLIHITSVAANVSAHCVVIQCEGIEGLWYKSAIFSEPWRLFFNKNDKRINEYRLVYDHTTQKVMNIEIASWYVELLMRS